MAGLRSVIGACMLVAVAATEVFYSRELPADTLRDFPNQCFASTQCRVYPINETWSVFPFCGSATCTQTPNGLVELLKECPLPKELPGCTIQEVAPDPTVLFPDCCPKVDCPPETKAEYYTQEEAKTIIAKRREEAEAEARRLAAEQEAGTATQQPSA